MLVLAAAAAAAYLSYELDDLDEDVERGVPGDHAAGALGEQSRHDAQETAMDVGTNVTTHRTRVYVSYCTCLCCATTLLYSLHFGAVRRQDR